MLIQPDYHHIYCSLVKSRFFLKQTLKHFEGPLGPRSLRDASHTLKLSSVHEGTQIPHRTKLLLASLTHTHETTDHKTLTG